MPTDGEAFHPLLLETGGTVSHTATALTASGNFSSLATNLGGPLLAGNFTIPIGTAATSSLAETSGAEMAGLTTAFTGMSFCAGHRRLDHRFAD